MCRGVATEGARAMVSPLQFPNQTRSNSFSFKRQGYCFLWVLRKYTDQKTHDFYSACENFWITYSRFFNYKVEIIDHFMLDVLKRSDT